MEKHERIKILRILNGFTQEDLAAASNIKQASIASYERGTYGIPEGSIKNLSKPLMVDPAYLQYGYPSLSGRVWNPPIDGKGLVKVLRDLLPKLLEENSLSASVTRKYVDGRVTLLMSQDGRACLYISRSAKTTFHIINSSASDSEGLVPVEVFLKFARKNAVKAGETKFISDLKIADFGVKNLAETDFEWPAGLFEEQPSYEKAFKHLLHESLEYLLIKTVEMAQQASIPEIFCEMVAPQIQDRFVKLATEMVDKQKIDATASMKKAIDTVFANALKTCESGSSEVVLALNRSYQDDDHEQLM